MNRLAINERDELSPTTAKHRINYMACYSRRCYMVARNSHFKPG